jgi:hypothetical protein
VAAKTEKITTDKTTKKEKGRKRAANPVAAEPTDLSIKKSRGKIPPTDLKISDEAPAHTPETDL